MDVSNVRRIRPNATLGANSLNVVRVAALTGPRGPDSTRAHHPSKLVPSSGSSLASVRNNPSMEHPDAPADD